MLHLAIFSFPQSGSCHCFAINTKINKLYRQFSNFFPACTFMINYTLKKWEDIDDHGFFFFFFKLKENRDNCFPLILTEVFFPGDCRKNFLYFPISNALLCSMSFCWCSILRGHICPYAEALPFCLPVSSLTPQSCRN